MSTIGAITNNTVTRRLTEMKNQLERLHIQLGTGKRANTYRDLGTSRSISLNARGRLDSIAAYQQNITTVDLRLKITSTTLARFQTLASEQRSENLSTQYAPTNGVLTAQQKSAEQRLDEILSLMNQDVNGRRLFSGRATDTDATLDTTKILDGNPPQEGLRAIIEERRRADLGTANLGRLSIDTSTPGQARLSETAGVVFGFKIGAVSSNLSNATAATNAGPPPRLDVVFSGLPQEGQSAQITLNLPDGTTKTITMRATASPQTAGDFVIGASANATALNFATSLNTELQRQAQTTLRSASTLKASSDFFNISTSQAPQRVNIVTTPEAATTLRNGTTSDTVFWYQGDDTVDDPRSTSTVRADTALTLGYGMRATEAGFRQVISGLAAFAAVEFDPSDSNTIAAYSELSSRVRDKLGETGGQTLETIQLEIASVHSSIKAAADRHVNATALFENVVQGVESISQEEVAALILDLQTRLEASYQVTANLAKLSLVNFI